MKPVRIIRYTGNDVTGEVRKDFTLAPASSGEATLTIRELRLPPPGVEGGWQEHATVSIPLRASDVDQLRDCLAPPARPSLLRRLLDWLFYGPSSPSGRTSDR